MIEGCDYLSPSIVSGNKGVQDQLQDTRTEPQICVANWRVATEQNLDAWREPHKVARICSPGWQANRALKKRNCYHGCTPRPFAEFMGYSHSGTEKSCSSSPALDVTSIKRLVNTTNPQLSILCDRYSGFKVPRIPQFSDWRPSAWECSYTSS